MAEVAYSVVATETNKVWRKIQGEAAEVLPVLSEEFDMLEDFLPPEGTPWSQREVLVPLDINDGYGAASIVPGDFKAVPSTPDMDELTILMVEYNKRFAATLFEQWGDKAEAEVTRVLKYKAVKALRAMADYFSDSFYGTTVGTVALTDSDVSGTTNQTLTLHSGYGQSTISLAAFLAAKFKVGERIALIDGTSLVTNGIGTIDTVTAATPSIRVDFQGAVSVTNNNLKVVKANSMGNTTIDHTDYGKQIVGLVDITRTDSVHGVAASVVPNWDVAYSDVSGGAFDGVRLRKGEDASADFGGRFDVIAIDKAVYRDWYRTERSVLRHDDPFGMETDGDIKSKGRRFLKTRRSIPGEVIAFKKGAVKRWHNLPKPDNEFRWSDGLEHQDKSQLVFNMPWPVATVCRNRKHFASWTGLDRN